MRKAFGVVLGAVSVLFIFVVLLKALLAVTSPSGPVVQSAMQDGANQVAIDAVKEYKIAQRSGTAIDVCVQAGFVSAAYLQAQDSEHYAEWKQVEKRDCGVAGMPQ